MICVLTDLGSFIQQMPPNACKQAYTNKGERFLPGNFGMSLLTLGLGFNNPSVKEGKCSEVGCFASSGQNNWLIVRCFARPFVLWVLEDNESIQTQRGSVHLSSQKSLAKLCQILCYS